MYQVNIQTARNDIQAFKSLYLHNLVPTTFIHTLEKAVDRKIHQEERTFINRLKTKEEQDDYMDIPSYRLPISVEYSIMCYHNVQPNVTRSISFR